MASGGDPTCPLIPLNDSKYVFRKFNCDYCFMPFFFAWLVLITGEGYEIQLRVLKFPAIGLCGLGIHRGRVASVGLFASSSGG